MKINPEWLLSDPVQTLKFIFDKAGLEAYFVGGCVRNHLMGVPASDLDLATPVVPERVMKLAQAHDLKVIPTGLEHGTVTIVILGISFEITTFRKDVSTNGRHADVAFSSDILDDSSRRDFTMNAIYADFNGTIYDPLGGMSDLENRRVRFIGDANLRIQEDYLRILRFFRFYAVYGDHSEGVDPEALAACAQNLEGLPSLSRERVSSEMVKLLSATAPTTSIGAMEASGVLTSILEGASTRTFFPFVDMEFGANPMARLAALGEVAVNGALRLSKKQAREYEVYRCCMQSSESLLSIAHTHGVERALAVCALRAATFEQPVDEGIIAKLQNAANAIFPISASDLIPDFSGANLGRTLKKLKSDWIDSEFTLTKRELLGSIGIRPHDTD